MWVIRIQIVLFCSGWIFALRVKLFDINKLLEMKRDIVAFSLYEFVVLYSITIKIN